MEIFVFIFAIFILGTIFIMLSLLSSNINLTTILSVAAFICIILSSISLVMVTISEVRFEHVSDRTVNDVKIVPIHSRHSHDRYIYLIDGAQFAQNEILIQRDIDLEHPLLKKYVTIRKPILFKESEGKYTYRLILPLEYRIN